MTDEKKPGGGQGEDKRGGVIIEKRDRSGDFSRKEGGSPITYFKPGPLPEKPAERPSEKPSKSTK